MKLKKFEQYKFDTDTDDIAIEYSKLILSTYLDKKNEETLESVYADTIKSDELDEHQEYIVKNTMQDYIYSIFEEAEKIRPVIEIDASKYKI